MPLDLASSPPATPAALGMVRVAVEALHGTSTAPFPAAAEADWTALARLAWDNKMLVLVQRGLDRLGIDQPEPFRDAVRLFRQQALRINARNLATIRGIVPPLLAAGLNVLVFKGPVQQQLLHGDHFVRPAGDIDILADEAEFDRAAAVLGTIGYEMAAECGTPWWRRFLGEQHFFASDATRSVIDLHHRIQQPGCPAPRRLDDFLATRASVPLGQLSLPTLSLESIALLSAISFVKAIVHREPAGSYACDLLIALASMDGRAQAQLRASAERQGLLNTLQTALHAAESLFGPVSAPALPRRAEPSCLDADLAAIVLTPERDDIAWPKRRQLLWELCDSSGPAGKPGTFALESARALTGELCRMIYEPRHIAAAPRPLAA